MCVVNVCPVHELIAWLERERCVVDSGSGLSEEFIERSIENKIQNYEQAVKIIEQQKELVESLKKQLTI